WKATVFANLERPDVKAAFPAQGTHHGFRGTLTLAAGSNQVCVYAINAGKGINPLIKCTTVTVGGATTPAPTPPPTTSGAIPRGDVNELTAVADGTVRVRGWVFDPDTASPIKADVWVDGAWKKTMLADQPRPDVKAA